MKPIPETINSQLDIKEKTSKSRVCGYLKAKGTSIVNGNGDEILLTGWGLGNWFLNEGYMWKSFHNSRFDRPRRIERVVEELTGKAYTQHFFEVFRSLYITEAEIRDLAESGYNSVRIPIHWRLLMEEGEEITFIESGFRLIDQCLDWCEKYSMYAFIDMHGAPGGQTGANIDDSIDDVPRLFIDEHSYRQCIELWKEIARRYKDRSIVGGYDLLNEPIRPGSSEMKSYDHLLPQLIAFYEDVIHEIRKIDDQHMLSIEGHHWSTSTEVFDRVYDPNMVIHFHRYGCNPDYQAFEEFVDLSLKMNLPLWLGETGENILEWFSAMYPLSLELNIGYNLWPAKKMEAMNSPYSIKEPEGWHEILSYLEGGRHPGYQKARTIFDELLHNIGFEHCVKNEHVTDAVFRQSGARVMGIDFDEFPGSGHSYLSNRHHENEHNHRCNTGMKLISHIRPVQSKIGFYNQWDFNSLALEKGEFACYTFAGDQSEGVWQVSIRGLENGELIVYENDEVIEKIQFMKEPDFSTFSVPSVKLDHWGVRRLKIEVMRGEAAVDWVRLT
ncbi:cellulase family glycosylhydrolase [Proteiniclasticum sp. SCR006]|uniref:Cellulase family glycosylhydrolase n=1 Tax=Proteiniclasticum aestuarii TaxID=2817862 RepID=A0A939HEV8_9CLOT|nr:cellulase family glycosylhydrolase [Proteiniclasticum aestuarii]MBO1266255.1 cellulase family glycosylhydrolase [Proteiniclasticum aestuarii]